MDYIKDIKGLALMANTIRQDTIKSLVKAGSGHTAGPLGMADVFSVVYFSGIFLHDPKNPDWEERDRFILSKGQASPALYTVLADCGYFDVKDLDKFATFFTPDATENDTPFQDMLPNYRKNLEKIQSFNYRIELITYSLQADTGTIKIQGKYFTRFLLHEGTWRENSGNISMELIENGDSYLVKRLSYGQ